MRCPLRDKKMAKDWEVILPMMEKIEIAKVEDVHIHTPIYKLVSAK